MSNEIEGFGQLATAGLTASQLDDLPSNRRKRARERAVREAQWWRRHPVEPADETVGPHSCANCDTHLNGDFCHVCGQSAHVHRSVWHLLEEFAHGLYHFDSKAWRTLPLLAFRPGKLTRDYTHGRRARYIAPLALFLLSVFLMFFIFGFVGGPNLGSDGKTPDQISLARSHVIRETASVAKAEAKLAEARKAPDADVAEAEANLAEERGDLVDAKAEQARIAALPLAEQRKIVAPDSWKTELAEAARSGELQVDTGIPSIDANIRKALQNVDFAIYKVQQKAYKLSFLLVPLSLPVLWVMFLWRRDVKLYDHVVFSLYSLSFMSLLLVVGVLINQIGGWTEPWMGDGINGLGSLLFLIPPVHMFLQLKGAYALGTGGALWRTFVLLIGSNVTLSLFAFLIVVLGLAD